MAHDSIQIPAVYSILSKQHKYQDSCKISIKALSKDKYDEKGGLIYLDIFSIFESQHSGLRLCTLIDYLSVKL